MRSGEVLTASTRSVSTCCNAALAKFGDSLVKLHALPYGHVSLWQICLPVVLEADSKGPSTKM